MYLALQVTIPIVLGIALAAWVGRRAGQRGIWVALGVVLFCAVVMWGVGWGRPEHFVQRFVAPVSIYAPPLVLGGITLALLGPSRVKVLPVAITALGWGVANLGLAQFFFVLGCALQVWICP